ncbi:hypothetical protein ACFY2Q_16610 [Micromonospora sp. NPDC000316]|uniref:MmyB family transcriptional regulator n=1 Tax=Micromonospora sp. NPDC000316 TaxID=3364216 RepID=UPI0036A3D5B3
MAGFDVGGEVLDVGGGQRVRVGAEDLVQGRGAGSGDSDDGGGGLRGVTELGAGHGEVVGGHLADAVVAVGGLLGQTQAVGAQEVGAQIARLDQVDADPMVDHPAFVVGRRTDVLASNVLARALLTDWTRLPSRQRNYTRWVFLDPAARDAFLNWPTVAAEVVGTLRLYAGRFPDDPQLNELVGELTIKSPEFRTWWNGHRVHERTHGIKHMRHPAVGPITIRYEALALPGDEEQTLFVYTTDPGSLSHDNMRLLALLATQHQTDSTPTGSAPKRDAARDTVTDST